MLRDKLSKDLAWAKSEIEKVRKSRIRLDAKRIYANLEKSDLFATAKVTFEIDLHNDSEAPSAEIEAIYFYTGNEWKVIQESTECPSTDADLPTWKYRHFIASPVKRLSRGGWAQLRFRAERDIASVLDGDVLKDSYPVTGQAILRLVTDQGNFDSEINIDVVAEVFVF